MKIFPSDTISALDRATCEAQGIDSLDLMERAASAVACEIMQLFLTTQRIVIVAGSGNNGGDALAVARILIEQGYGRVETYLFNVTGKLSRNCEHERRKLLELDGIRFTMVEKEFVPPVLGRSDVVVDGLFGSGLRQPLQGGFVTVARYINASGAFVVSIDVPSGLFGEWNDKTITRDMVHASLTLTFQQPRLSFFFAEHAEVIGKFKILDIGLDKEAILKTPTDYIMVEEKNVRSMLRPRALFTNKHDYGSIGLIAGSAGMYGAAIMAARAAMRSGAGLVTVHTSAYGMVPVQTAVPEALFEADRNERHITDMRLTHEYSAVAVGPGIGTEQDTIDAIEGLLNRCKAPLVLDADALNCIAAKPALLSMLPQNAVLTPHAGEFDRLFGKMQSGEERLRKAIEMAQYFQVTIVLKGYRTTVVRPTGKIYINTTGNPGMATAGAGDVLTGVIAAFMAQGYRPELAATMGVYFHGMAGDMAAKTVGQFGITASDIADHVGLAIQEVLNHKNKKNHI